MSNLIPLRFEIYQDGELVRSERLEQDIIKIGKLPSSHLRIEDAKVSRIHAVIERSGDEGYHIIDLGSSKGTFVNGEKVNKQELSDGDEITLGDTKVKVVFDMGATASASPSADTAAAPVASGHPGGVSNVDGEAEVIGGMGLGAAGFNDTAANPFAAPPASNPFAAPPAANPFAAPPASNPFAAPPASNPFAAPAPGASNPFAAPTPGPAADAYSPAAIAAAMRPKKKKKRKKKRKKKVVRDHFERRFLSERFRGGAGALEIAMLWRGQVFQIDQFRGEKSMKLTMGSDEDVTYPVDHDAVGGQLVFAEAQGGAWTIQFTDQMSGFVLVDKEKYGKEKFSFKEAEAQGIIKRGGKTLSLPLSGATRAKIVIGDVTFLVHFISLPALSIPLLAGVGVAGVLTGLLASIILHGVFGAFVAYYKQYYEELGLDSLSANSAFAEALITPDEEEEPEEEEIEEEEDEPEDAPQEDEGAKAAEEEGKIGKPEETNTSGSFAIAGDADKMELKKQFDTQAAMNAGVLSEASTMASLLGTGAESAGFDQIDAWGDFESSAAAGDVAGGYGLGQQGSGRGGGGSNYGGFGAGDFGTAGRGGGGSGGSKYGSDAVDLKDKKGVKPKLKPGNPDVTGSLDRRIIRKVINQHKNEVKKCYERELMKDPTLHGKVEVGFTISPKGDVMVAQVKSNSVNQSVGSCLAGRVKSWRFPAPKGGGLVKVTYPFVFSNGAK